MASTMLTRSTLAGMALRRGQVSRVQVCCIVLASRGSLGHGVPQIA